MGFGGAGEVVVSGMFLTLDKAGEVRTEAARERGGGVEVIVRGLMR